MDKMTRREFLKIAGSAAVGAAAYGAGLQNVFAAGEGSVKVTDSGGAGSRAKVYFSRNINAETLIKLYDMVNEGIYGNVAIKLHTGEPHGPNILPRDMVKAFQAHVSNSNIVETNALYAGGRDNTEKHRATIALNGWDFCPVDIMDEEGTVMLPVRGGKHMQKVSMGGHIVNYDSMIVLTHFKGHAAGGFGGSLKNIAIGCADAKVGKAMQHGGADFSIRGAHFMEHMVEAGKAVTDFFGKRIAYVNVMRRMSVRCDCAGPDAEEPTIGDIGMVASTDLLAIDQACVDMVYDKPGGDNKDLIERIESREGLRQLSYMKELKMGNPNYELISID